MHDFIVHDLLFYLVLVVLYLSVFVTVKYIVLLFWCPSCIVIILSYSYFCCSFLFCVHLLVRLWRTLIFQHLSLRRSWSHCTREPRETFKS